MYNSPASPIVLDTSAVIAVLINEPAKGSIITATINTTLVAPGSLPWEVGNALSAMFKRGRINLDQALEALYSYEQIPVRIVDVDFEQALKLAKDFSIYAYDAYMLACAITFSAPILTLDDKLAEIANAKGIKVLEV
jgi:predicted nucleic acid-binding protein